MTNESRIPPSTEQQRISEIEAALAAKDAAWKAAAEEGLAAWRERTEAAERQVAELKRSFEQMGNEHQQMYHALREVITAVGGIAEEGVSVEFACFAPGEVRGRVAKLKRELGERDTAIDRLKARMEITESTEDAALQEAISCGREAERLKWSKEVAALRAQLAHHAERLRLLNNEIRRTKYADPKVERVWTEAADKILDLYQAARSEGGSTKGTAHSADAEGARNASDLGGDSREER